MNGQNQPGQRNGQIHVYRIARAMQKDSGQAVSYSEQIPVLRRTVLETHCPIVAEVMTELAEDNWPGIRMVAMESL